QGGNSNIGPYRTSWNGIESAIINIDRIIIPYSGKSIKSSDELPTYSWIFIYDNQGPPRRDTTPTIIQCSLNGSYISYCVFSLRIGKRGKQGCYIRITGIRTIGSHIRFVTGKSVI